MISLIIKSYLVILLSVGIGSLLVFALGLTLIFKLMPQRARVAPVNDISHDEIPIERAVNKSLTITSSDIAAISGEDTIATQLDLARAYIETGRQTLAKKILDYVLQQGNNIQQAEALRIMNLLKASSHE
ncbi:MAG: hypothetical protein A3F14_06735 [Gammaproteobacteria bacterium RIFCSPHIGHO2_12_FULL_43_28]|nr:MAG: hypothetical protein A3F14_06735 [Gammaproteobacteria bacterium RIFCSPHIGHO2_12_FULL_43_28]